MTPDESFAAALAQARALGPPPPGHAPVEAFRTEAVDWLARVPEPPLYPRTDDPARASASELLPQGIGLLARGWGLQESGRSSEADQVLTRALHAHVEALAATTEGRIVQAEEAWARANALERESRTRRRAWVREDELERPVWDASTRISRYDPRPAPTVRARLFCAHPGCHAEQDLTFPPTYALHSFVCGRCRQGFSAYLAESRRVTSARTALGTRHAFRLEPLGGGASRVEFEEAGTEPFHAARGDLLAFLYTEGPVLRGVTNLSGGRTLWVRRGGPCYVATAVYGADAPEVDTLRRWRDEVLRRRPIGRAAMAWYYRASPSLVRWLQGRPRTQRWIRRGLDAWVRRIE